jgi:hypothetical protein
MQTDPTEPLREDGEPRRDAPPPTQGRALDPAALFVLLDALRRAAPRELEAQVTNLIREFLLTLRSLIDWYLERLDRPRREPEVEDIPIE